MNFFIFYLFDKLFVQNASFLIWIWFWCLVEEALSHTHSHFLLKNWFDKLLDLIHNVFFIDEWMSHSLVILRNQLALGWSTLFQILHDIFWFQVCAERAWSLLALVFSVYILQHRIRIWIWVTSTFSILWYMICVWHI